MASNRYVFAVASLTVSWSWVGWEVVQRAVKPRQFDEAGRLAQMKEKDPKLSTPISLPGVPKKGRVAMIWLGDCTQCTRNTLHADELRQSTPQGTEVVLLVTGKTQRSEYAKEYKEYKTLSITDAQKNALNAFFAPRAYIVTDGALTGIQSMGEPPLARVAGRE